MDAHCFLYIDDFLIHRSQYAIDEAASILFTETDRIYTLQQSMRFADSDLCEEDLNIPVFQYEIEIKNAIERLELFGFTLEKSKTAFESGLLSLFDEPSYYIDVWGTTFYILFKGRR